MNDDKNSESELLARLAALPAPAVPAGAGPRIHRRSRAAYVRYSERARHPVFDRLARVYSGFEPVMATAVAAAYLFWAFASAMALHT